MGYLFVIAHNLIMYDARINFSIPKIFFPTKELILPLFKYVGAIIFFRRILDPPFSPTKRNKGLKIVEMSLNFYQGTTATHTILQVRTG